MKHEPPQRDALIVSGFRAARVPVTVVAMVAVLGVSISQARDSVDTLITPLEETTTAATAAASNTETTTEQPPVSEDTVIKSVVNYYQQACPALYSMVAVSDKVSVITENTLGQELGDEKITHADGIGEIVTSLNDASAQLRSIPAPDDLPGSSDADQEAYAAAVDKVSGQATTLTESLDPLSAQIREAESNDVLVELVDQYRTVIDTQAPTLTMSLNDMISVAGPSTSATGDAVRSLPECSPVFEPSPQPADTDVVGSAVDFHVRLTQAKNLVSNGTKKIDNIADETSGASFSDGRDIAAQAWRSRATAAQAALELLQGWQAPTTPTAAEANATAGYEQIRDDAVAVYTSIRDSANASADDLAAADNVSELNSALTSAAENTWNTSVEEAKLTVRVSRIASVPTTATADEVQRIVAENPVP